MEKKFTLQDLGYDISTLGQLVEKIKSVKGQYEGIEPIMQTEETGSGMSEPVMNIKGNSEADIDEYCKAISNQ